MQKLHPSQYACVQTLYAQTRHSRPQIFAVLEGIQPGEVFADDPAGPQAALVVLEDMIFPAGLPDAFGPEALRRLLRETLGGEGRPPFYELHLPNEAWRAQLEIAFGPAIVHRAVRLTFALPAGHAVPRPQIPAGFSLRAIDEALVAAQRLDAAFWSPDTGRFGMALLRDGEIVCDCFAVFVGGGMAEVAVGTKEAYQRQGLATLTSQAFIEACLGRGLSPNWACWQERTASAALARKLGFVEAGEHTALVIRVDAV